MSTTETGIRILGEIRSARPHVSPSQEWVAPRRHLGRKPFFLAFGAALAVTLAGFFLMAYGLTQAIVDGPGHPFPNSNHVSTIPTPPRR